MEIYKTAIFLELAREYKKYDLGMQLHMGAQRNNNTRMFEKLGADYFKKRKTLDHEIDKTLSEIQKILGIDVRLVD